VQAIRTDWRTAELAAADRALCEYADKLTRTPAAIAQADIDALRAAGLSDTAILEANEVCAYFNYINRVADGLGIDPEPEMGEEPKG